MISFVRALLVSKAADSPRGAWFLVDLHGMGMELLTSTRSVESAPQPGEEVLFYTALLVREDAMQLVGFNTREERDLFNILCSASGVGPKVALALLSGLSVSEVAQAVVSGQHKILTTAKGVGPKLAQKITLDLKEKMTVWRKEDVAAILAGSTTNRPKEQAQIFTEAETVLLSLGYEADEISRSFADIAPEPAPESAEEVLRVALKWLAQKV